MSLQWATEEKEEQLFNVTALLLYRRQNKVLLIKMLWKMTNAISMYGVIISVMQQKRFMLIFSWCLNSVSLVIVLFKTWYFNQINTWKHLTIFLVSPILSFSFTDLFFQNGISSDCLPSMISHGLQGNGLRHANCSFEKQEVQNFVNVTGNNELDWLWLLK